MNHNVDDVFAMLRHALPYCYEAADQTVQCPECNTYWWDVPFHARDLSTADTFDAVPSCPFGRGRQ